MFAKTSGAAVDTKGGGKNDHRAPPVDTIYYDHITIMYRTLPIFVIDFFN